MSDEIDDAWVERCGYKLTRNVEQYGNIVLPVADEITWTCGPLLKVVPNLPAAAILAIANHWMYGFSAGEQAGRVRAFKDLRSFIGVEAAPNGPEG